ncbi:MAG: Eco57I restriction-modification methylase domain-containing protein [Christensenellales bacterium]
MSSGGLRENAGRKRIGVVINTRIEEQLIEQIEYYINGLSRADKIRKCLLLGIEHKKNSIKNSYSESNTNTISKFYKTYISLLSLINKSETENVQILNEYLLCFFTSTPFDYTIVGIDEKTHKSIVAELKKFNWSIDECENQNNVITPAVIGSVVEKVVNQKETGSYYTPRDTTNYIASYSIVFSLLNKCNSSALAVYFYEQYEEPTNLSVLNDTSNPVEKLANAINQLPYDEKQKVFENILGFSIIDPTCGTGAFIIAAADIMVDLYKLTNMYLHVSLNDFVVNLFKNCLFGVDILEYAISLIRLRCKLYLYNLGISKNIVDSIDFQFYQGDSLTLPNTKDALFSNEGSFSTFINSGGFDCIIGNPPYVESSKINLDINQYGEYKTKRCGNLYAYILENSFNLLKENSYLGMIVPISITSTQRMESLRNLLFEKCESIYIANFSDRPACLFTGVHQKLSIVFAKKTKPLNGCKLYTSTYKHWSKNERATLFDSISYCRTTKNFVQCSGIAKVGDDIKLSILKKVLDNTSSFDDLISQKENDNKIYINQRMTFWAKCFSSPEPSKEYKTYCIKDSINRKSVAALINSSLFYLIWESYSDCWHITQQDLSNLRISKKFFDEKFQSLLEQLEVKLEERLYQTREYIYSKQTDYIYMHRLCYKEITAINEIVAELYGFDNIEKEYIQTYNEKYRLSVSSITEEK